MSRIRFAIWLSVGVLSLIGLPVRAAETVKTAEQGNVRAELSYEKVATEGLPQVKNMRLKISRAGTVVLNQAPIDNEYDRPLVDFTNSTNNGEESFAVRDLDGDKEPEVVVDFYTGGAHCCTYSLIYRWVPNQNRYEPINHPWGNVGYTLKDLDRDGRPEFESADNRFAYAFASYAGSGMPIQIWKYEKGQMTDVTRRYPKLVYADATRWWQVYNEAKSRDGEVKGILAAYLATKYLLGQQQDGWQRVQQIYGGSDRQDFFNNLRQFLKETGYEN
jgi:hypothetical protein